MASTGKIDLAEALPITGAGQTSTKATEPLQKDYIFYASVAGATGNVTVKLQNSADNITWFDVATLAVINAGSPAAKLDITAFLLPLVRVDFNDSGNSVLTARIYYKPSR